MTTRTTMPISAIPTPGRAEPSPVQVNLIDAGRTTDLTVARVR